MSMEHRSNDTDRGKPKSAFLIKIHFVLHRERNDSNRWLLQEYWETKDVYRKNHTEQKYATWAKWRWIIVRVNMAVHALSTVLYRVANTVTSDWSAILTISVVNTLVSADGNCIVQCYTPFSFLFEIFTLPISYPFWTATRVATHGLRNANPCHESPLVRESRGNGNGNSDTAAGAAADERSFFFVLVTNVPYYQTHDVNLSIFSRSRIVR